MLPPVLILNGPNLNMLGLREPAVYGSATLDDVHAQCQAAAQRLGSQAHCFQSNWEGALIDKLHEWGALAREGRALGCVFNPGGLTHSSVALRDAVAAAAPLGVIECHISNVHARESFRHRSYISAVAMGVVAGLGTEGYVLAIEALARKHVAARN